MAKLLVAATFAALLGGTIVMGPLDRLQSPPNADAAMTPDSGTSGVGFDN